MNESIQQKQAIMSISIQGIILVVIAGTLMSAASLMLKQSIGAIGGFGEGNIIREIFALLLQPIFVLGVILYGSGTLLWMRVISTEPISIGYPILMGVAFLAITIGAAVFFKEAMSIPKILGMMIILVGVIVASQG